MNMSASTVTQLLDAGALGGCALNAPDGAPLNYGSLRQLVSDTIKALNVNGIGRNDRVAIVLDNGAEMAAVFLCISAGATAAPLNPGYRADEFEFYLSDLKAKLLIVEDGKTSPALDVARKLNIPLVRLAPMPGSGAGSFRLIFDPSAASKAAQPGAATPEDIALVLHTSGTTSRPKIVPLMQRNICASAHHIRKTLAFTASDRGLNIMPLFH